MFDFSTGPCSTFRPSFSHEAPDEANRSAWIIGGSLVAVAVLVLAAVWLLTRGGDDADPADGLSAAASDTSEGPTPEPSGSAQEVATADARLEGVFRFEMVGRSANVEGVEGATFRSIKDFVPQCDEGACDTAVGINAQTNGILLTRDGADYSGSYSGDFGSTCNGEAIDTEWTLNLRARKSEDGVVTRLEGTARAKIPAQGGCDAARASFDVEAFATPKSPSGGPGVPAIALENYPALNTPYDASKYLLDSWLDDDRPAAEWAGDAGAVNFLWGIARKDYRLTCSGLAYLGGKHCGLLLHKMKFPIIIFELRTNDDPAWKVKTAYWNAD